MPTTSREKLRGQLSQCAHEFAQLANDEEWTGQNPVVIRKAVPILIRRVAESARYVVVIAFELRSVRDPGPIRRALGLRDPNVLLRARWSHTEALLILASDPMEYCQTLAPILNNAGLSAALYFTPYSGNVQMDYGRATHSTPAHWVGERNPS